MQKTKKATLITGSIAKTLTKLTIPMVFGILGMVAFNLVDTFFIGQLGTLELAAISFTFPVVFIIGSLAMGLGMGASAVISRAIGEGDPYKVQRLTTDSLFLSVLVVVVFVGVGLASIEPVFGLLGATPEIMPLIKQYMLIWYPSMLFVVIPMVGNNAIRATGDTKTPSAVMLVAVVTNIILDPLLIFGFGPIPRLELAGAAIATATARAVTFLVAIWVLYYREQMITFVQPTLKNMLDSWKQILYIGLPAGGSNMVVPLGMGVITSLIAVHGPEAVAGFGVASRIDMFALTVILALSSVLGPFIGQNWGAEQLDRVNTGIKYSLQFALAWGVIMLALLALVARPVAALFNDNPVVISVTVIYLWIVPLSYGPQGMVMLTKTALNVLNKPIEASVLTIIQMFVLYIPLAYLGSYWLGVPGIFGAATIAHIIAGLVGYVWLRRILANEAPTLAQEVEGVPIVRPASQESLP